MPREAARDLTNVKKLDTGPGPLAKAKWESSGLNDAQAKKLKLKGLTPAETKALGDTFHAVRSLHIPYFGLAGKPTKFYRIRYLENLPGWAGVIEKPQRYAQPKGTLNEVYFPPLLDVSWADIAKDTSITIYITEGELKAACACAHGMACLGLGGVDVWRSTKREVPLLPALKEIKWENREVVIVYDSDAATNPNVVRAQRKLVEELVAHGALPSIASLPPRRDGTKQGLDDLLVADGVEALTEVLKQAPSYPEAAALWEMNEEIACIAHPGMLVAKASGNKIEVRKFIGLTHANRHYITYETNKDGVQIAKKKPLAKRWIEWEHRHELQGVVYAPGRGRIHEGMWNDWPGWGVEPKKGDLAPWHWLLDFIFKGHPKTREWFERWCAYPLQHPGTKLYSAPVIWSREHGTGKTLMFYALMRIYGPNAIEIKNKHLKAGFNAWQQNKQFVYGDEIDGNGDLGVKKIDAEMLKSIITQSHVTINQKYLPEYTVEDVINYGFAGNHPDMVFMDDADRRFMIHEVVGSPAEREKYEACDRWLKGAGPAALFHHLLDLKLGDFNPRAHAPWTAAKEQMIRNSRSDVGAWAANLREDPERMLAPLGPTVAKECDLFTTSQLLFCYDPERRTKVGTIGLGKELQKMGLRQVNETGTIRTSHGSIRLVAVRNWERWRNASPKELGAHYDKYNTAGKFG